MTNGMHGILVDRAGRWLRHSAVITETWTGRPRRVKVRCGVVLTEMVTNSMETPDAIGWFCGGRFSIVIEVKTSRADFHKDHKKPFRQRPTMGVGVYRYYLSPPGLLVAADMPDKWGLLESDGARVAVAVDAEAFTEYAIREEKAMLFSALRRAQITRREELK